MCDLSPSQAKITKRNGGNGMKIDCDVIRDLLPLYVENMVSAKSRELIEKHLAECEECQKILSQMREKEPEIICDTEPIKRFRNRFRKHTITVAMISAFITVAILIIVQGIFFLQPGDEMGYTLLNFYFILPLAALISSILIGMRDTKIKWLIPIIFGAIGVFIPWVVFHNTNEVAVCLAFLPSLIGILSGTAIRTLKNKRKR